MTFNMYKRYIDPITGESVLNPFAKELYNERKVKLYYKNQWYDFIVKNITEESEKYLCTYQLEDALVQELSKNGYGVILDAQLQNNSGTAKELAAKVLAETDWEVDDESEVFVQTIEESLVYLKVKEAITAIHVLDQVDFTKGVEPGEATTIPAGSTIMAFYSSCTGKPYRFQFIYLNGADAEIDENDLVKNADCQYYIDIGAASNYSVVNASYKFSLPPTLETTEVSEGGQKVVISTKYRGARYSFVQQTEFAPALGRYVEKYRDINDDQEYYGYATSKYQSASTCKNIISNPSFKTSSGWVGTRKSSFETNGATITTDYGYFSGGSFHSVIGTGHEGKTYLRIDITNPSGDIVINSGPKDNRTYLQNISVGETWVFGCTCKKANGQDYTNITPSLGDYSYAPSGGYEFDDKVVLFSSFKDGESTVVKSEYTSGNFQRDGKTCLCLSFGHAGTYYLESIYLYKKIVLPDGSSDIRPLLSQEDITKNPTKGIETKYYYFTPDKLKGIRNESELVYDCVESTLNYSRFIPIFNDKAEKIKSVNAKESNYFNILQNIAETFSGWVQLNVMRDPVTGQIQEKKIKLKNYINQNNYTGFRYGVNLKKIQRTFESKQITTKLIVKQNNNEYAPNGFCTIVRAFANPSGENYIYDFSYFFEQGMINKDDFFQHTYIISPNSMGRDINPEHTTTTLQGYFPRIKNLNVQIDELSGIMSEIALELVQNNADLEVARAGRISAEAGKEDASFEYKRLCGQFLEDAHITVSQTIRGDVKRIVEDYINFQSEYNRYKVMEETLDAYVKSLQGTYDDLNSTLEELLSQKSELNKLFFSHYSRFILEGTWMDEKYITESASE